jgi:hypothetical protein
MRRYVVKTFKKTVDPINGIAHNTYDQGFVHFIVIKHAIIVAEKVFSTGIVIGKTKIPMNGILYKGSSAASFT